MAGKMNLGREWVVLKQLVLFKLERMQQSHMMETPNVAPCAIVERLNPQCDMLNSCCAFDHLDDRDIFEGNSHVD